MIQTNNNIQSILVLSPGFGYPEPCCCLETVFSGSWHRWPRPIPGTDTRNYFLQTIPGNGSRNRFPESAPETNTRNRFPESAPETNTRNRYPESVPGNYTRNR